MIQQVYAPYEDKQPSFITYILFGIYNYFDMPNILWSQGANHLILVTFSIGLPDSKLLYSPLPSSLSFSTGPSDSPSL